MISGRLSLKMKKRILKATILKMVANSMCTFLLEYDP